MSIFALAIPAEIALFDASALLAAAANVLRPVLGLGAVATLMVYFKPLWMGLLRAALMLIKPRKSLDQRIARSKFMGQQLMRRMANDHAVSQPNLAAELRLLAGRD
ncbi:hypothetical protein CAter282_4602 [Collimonas arenae]|uniref:Transmembrane protein n=1 Tax=Collimonas arenae TaxID=279058 RepID=A0A127PX23_9BURK|nr:hypothetical protein [Collimonas arenae]AMP02363.1 hypothetical protein CAter10_5005 [Collimonas arenae]AMP12257.1 hypothetical protein CAter282_4602 [Collimonas arenae]